MEQCQSGGRVTDFWRAVPEFLPSWLMVALAFLAAAECVGLSLYLMHTRDHLVLHAADLGLMGVFAAFVGVHYLMIYISSDPVRGVAMSRLAWGMFLGADVVIVGRYLFVIGREHYAKGE